MVVTGVWLLGDAVGRLDARGAIELKTGSLTGGALLGLGYGLGGHVVHHEDALWAVGCAPVLKFIGAGMMGYTMPSFIGNAEAVLGDLPLGPDRGNAVFAAYMFGIATLLASTSLTTARLPSAAAQAVVNVGAFATMLALGVAYRQVRPWPVQPRPASRERMPSDTPSAGEASMAPSWPSPADAIELHAAGDATLAL